MSDAGTMVRDWVKSFDKDQREKVQKALKPEQWTQLEAFETGSTLPDTKAIKGFIEGIDAKQKGQIAAILKPMQLAELWKIGGALKAASTASAQKPSSGSNPKPFIIKK
jgi:hypothetical protein